MVCLTWTHNEEDGQDGQDKEDEREGRDGAGSDEPRRSGSMVDQGGRSCAPRPQHASRECRSLRGSQLERTRYQMERVISSERSVEIVREVTYP